MHTTVFQAEIIAIDEACKKFIDTKQSNMQYIKNFSDSQAAILALNSNTVTSSLVKQTITTLNALADSTTRVEIYAVQFGPSSEAVAFRLPSVCTGISDIRKLFTDSVFTNKLNVAKSDI